MRDDEELVAVAIKGDASCIKYASPRLQNTPRLAMLALGNGGSIRYICEQLYNNRDVMLAAVRANHTVFPLVPDQLRGDRQIAIAAMRYHGLNLASLSKELRVDREVVLAAISSNGNALHLASEDLRADKLLLQVAAANINVVGHD